MNTWVRFRSSRKSRADATRRVDAAERIGSSSCVFRTADTRQYDNQASDGGLLPVPGPVRSRISPRSGGTRRHLAVFVRDLLDCGRDLERVGRVARQVGS